MNVKDILLEDIDTHVFNSRRNLAPIDVIDLMESIKEKGLMQPVVVCEYSREEQESIGKKYHLIAGFRRTFSMKCLGWEKIPCNVVPHMDEATAIIANLSENINRREIGILDEAFAINKLKELGITEDMTAKRLNKSRGWVQVRYMLLDLPPEVQKEVDGGMITQAGIRELYTINNNEGKDACFKAAKTLKEAKARGEKQVTLNPNKKISKKKAKHQRTRKECNTMINWIGDSQIGCGIWTQAIAWCAGEISSGEFYEALEDYADANALTFVAPKDEE